jgi:hypothetical protein
MAVQPSGHRHTESTTPSKRRLCRGCQRFAWNTQPNIREQIETEETGEHPEMFARHTVFAVRHTLALPALWAARQHVGAQGMRAAGGPILAPNRYDPNPFILRALGRSLPSSNDLIHFHPLFTMPLQWIIAHLYYFRSRLFKNNTPHRANDLAREIEAFA